MDVINAGSERHWTPWYVFTPRDGVGSGWERGMGGGDKRKVVKRIRYHRRDRKIKIKKKKKR